MNIDPYAVFFLVGMIGGAANSKGLAVTVVYALGLVTFYGDTTTCTLLMFLYVMSLVLAGFIRD